MDNVMDEAKIAADMEGLENEIQEEFTKDVGTCVSWSGSFGERRKRSLGMETEGEGQGVEEVPSVMDSGRRAMGWVRKLVRKVRSPGQKNPTKRKNCQKGDKKCREERRRTGRNRNNKGAKKNNGNNKRRKRQKEPQEEREIKKE